MSKIDDSVRFYRKMSDLQEKLRRSEEERLQLEEKFALLMRACRDEEEIRLNLLREKYEKFLEEEKIRKERNERILLALERIESRANILTAKSERLRLLRRHYEAYLMRMYPKWSYITDKSKAATNQDLLTNPSYGLDEKVLPVSFHPSGERELRSGTPLPQYNQYGNLTVPASYQFPPPEERTISSAPVARPFSTSSLIPPLPTLIDSTAKYDREVKVSDSKPPGQIPTIRTLGPVLPERSRAEGPIISRANTQLLSGAERTTELLSVKTDQRYPLNSYLNDAHALNVKQTEHILREYANSEQEQNTSGDLLNVSLSDDGILHEEVEHTKNENIISQTEVTHKNNRELAGGDVFQANSKTSQQMSAIPQSKQLGAGDFGKQRSKIYPQNQKTEPEKSLTRMHDQIQIAKQYNQENRQDMQQHVGEQHLQSYEPINEPQDQNFKHQQQSKVQLSEPAEHQLVTQEQIQPAPEEHMREQNAETDMQQSRNYTDEYQKQLDQQSAEPNFNYQYDQQLAGIQSGHPYLQEYPAQYDQHYSEEGQLDEQYNFQYPEQGEMDPQYNVQYSDQDQMNQQYYEQYPEQGEITQQYVEQSETNEQYDQQYAEQTHTDQQYDQQYLEHAPDDPLYQQQYDNQDQYAPEYGESQQVYHEEADASYAISEQQNDDGIQHAENQQYNVTTPSGEEQKYEQNLGAQQETSVEENLPQAQHPEDYGENVQQLHSAHQMQQQKDEQQPQEMHEADGLHQQQPPPEQQQLSSDAAPQPDEPQKQKQAEIHKNEQESIKEVETALGQQYKQSDEHQSTSGDKEPEADIEEYRRLLGETGEVETSETDELEAQLAELVEQKADGAKEVNKTNQQPKPAIDKPVTSTANPVTEAGNIDDTSSSDTGGNIPLLLQETSATKLNVETLNAPEKQTQSKEEAATPVSKVRPASKRLPVLNKVLESDSESLQLDATISHAESDDFDFSSEQ